MALLLGASDIFDPFNFNSLLFGGRGSAAARDFIPMSVDWKETADTHIFKANLPGVSREEVKVEVEEGRVLQISGEKKKEEAASGDRWHRAERTSGRYQRRFRLPENAKTDSVKASMENGVLTVTIPKIPKPAPRTIEIAG